MAQDPQNFVGKWTFYIMSKKTMKGFSEGMGLKILVKEEDEV